MKKILSVLSALSIIVTFASCSSETKHEVSEMNVSADVLADAAYRKTNVELPKEINQIYTIAPFSNGEKLFLIASGNTTPAFYTAAGDLSGIAPMEISDFDIGITYNVDVAEDGRIIEFLIHADYGDLPEPDYYSEDYDAELYEASAVYSMQIHIYNADGTEVLRNIVTNYPGYTDNTTIISGIATDGKYLIANINGSYELFTVEGEYVREITVGEGESIEEIGRDKNGIVFAVENSDEKLEIRRLDSETGEIKPAEFTYAFDETVQQIMYGNGEYPLFIRTRSRVYGIKENSEMEVLFNCNAAQVNSDRVNGFIRDGAGNFTFCENSYTDFSVKVKNYVPCDPAELENIPTLDIGVSENERMLADIVENYNDSQNDVRINLVSYEGKDWENPEAVTKLEEDLISGEIPDMFAADSDGWFCDINLKGKGVFCDLVPFLEKDDDVNPDNIYPQIYEAMKDENGEISILPEGWALDLGYGGKAEHLQNIESWDINSYLDFLEADHGDMKIKNYQEADSQIIRFCALSWFNWVDIENASCNFDSDSFVRFLDYVMAYTEEEKVYGDDYDYTEEARQYMDDKTILASISIGNFDSYMRDLKGQFNGEPVTILGNPEENGAEFYISLGGVWSFGIAESSDNKELAWDFIKYMINYDFTANNSQVWGFPLTVSRFIDEFENIRDGRDYYVYEGDTEKKLHGWYYGTGDEDIDMGKLTEEDLGVIFYYLDKAVPERKGTNNGDNTPYNIYYEEIDRLFAGEYTTKKCAEVIQDRMEIYLSEQYG